AKVVAQLRAVQVAHHAEEEVVDFPRIEKVVRVILKHPPGRLLDVGYSKGGFADYLVRAGWDCTGLDLNERQHPGIRMIQCDLNEGFPVEDESFDVVTAGEIIEHMLDEEAFLQECRRVLKPGGQLVLTTPNLSFSVNRLLVLIGETPVFVYAPYHYHFHTRKTLISLVEPQRFVVERVIASHVLYSRRRHPTGWIFERLADWFPTLGAHLILFARRQP
ncbi:MAG: class I SAM-dependent methyltransferase, partial [Terriglobia bacterium]